MKKKTTQSSYKLNYKLDGKPTVYRTKRQIKQAQLTLNLIEAKSRLYILLILSFFTTSTRRNF